jgi:hypothetical protein
MIQAFRVTKRYSEDGVALREVTLHVPRGELFFERLVGKGGIAVKLQPPPASLLRRRFLRHWRVRTSGGADGSGNNAPTLGTTDLERDCAIARTITQAQLSPILADLGAGNIYANIHTPNFPGGEIPGQLARQ